jgi:signal peptidase II
MILGGAAGNLIDRIRWGRVVDFFDLHIGSFHWPAFNIADSAISFGIAIFAYYVIFRKVPI